MFYEIVGEGSRFWGWICAPRPRGFLSTEHASSSEAGPCRGEAAEGVEPGRVQVQLCGL